MDTRHITALVLAAGKGTRMHTADPKVLARLLDAPMLAHVDRALADIFSLEQRLYVVGHGADQVRDRFPDLKDAFVLQGEQLGTGHAVATAWERIKATGADRVLVVNGDTPLLLADHLESFLAEARHAQVAFISITPDDPGSLGRVVRDADGAVTGIVEAKDFDPARHGAGSGEVNAGIYLLDVGSVAPLLERLGNDNASGEYYITDLVDLAREAGLEVEAVNRGNDPGLLGINTPAELVRAEEVMRRRVVDRLLDMGVVIRQPDSVRVSPLAEIDPGAEITGPCEIYGRCRLAGGARVESHCVLRDSTVAEGGRVREFSHLEGAVVGEGASAGPYARLRPGAVLGRKAMVGNFVEVKKATLGENAKASHLTYLGDARIGRDVNIGAGTVTCNYDGRNKHETVIGDASFIGSNTSLVAPITLGRRVLVGAGSTLTRDVDDEELAVARQRQKTLPRKK
jgi:bifunctional UDP-N-acetylglucosamine pyrophosphorylase/glucosamine-1-phosphate N-acetyltransferase